MSAIVWQFEHYLALPFIVIGMKTDLFQATGLEILQICWHIECRLFTASSFRIWNSSTLRPTWLHISGCLALGKWSHHHDYLGCEDLFFFNSSSVYSCHLFLISSDSVKSIPFLAFIESIFPCNIPLVSLIFLKRPLVFHILLFSSISLHWSLRKAFLSLLAILWNFTFRCLYLSFHTLLFHFSSFHTYL